MRTKIIIASVIVLALAFAFSCSEHERDNPLDPGSPNFIGASHDAGNSSSDGQSSSSGGVSSSSDESSSSSVPSSSSSDETEPSSSSCDDANKCGGECYNKETHFCSNNTSYPFCNGKDYLVGKYICCENETHPKASHGCCDGKLYLLSGYSCQGSTVFTRCGAGESWFDPAIQFCSAYEGGTVLELCNGKQYDHPNQECFGSGSDKVVKGECGGEAINLNIYFCYGNTRYDLCNGNDYNPTKDFCYNGNEVRNMCDGVGYTTTQFCYNGTEVRSKCGTETYTATQFCHTNNQVYDKCNDVDYNPDTHYCHQNALYSCGGTPYNPTAKFCYENSKIGSFCGTRTEAYDPDKYECGGSAHPNWIYLKTAYKPTDSNGKSYKAVLIGTQTWMAENLNYKVDGSPYYSNDSAAYSKYGRLYNWATAMNNSASSSANPNSVQGVCPSDWHLPSNAEWDALVTAVGGSSTGGTKLKAASGWNINGTDDYGFSALPGGMGSGGSFYVVGNNGYWWSSTQYNTSNAYYKSMSEYVYVDNQFNDKFFLFSVRCVQD